jgi:hypothetical protein
MKARNLTKEQVIHDVLLAAQPTKEFVTSEQVAALALFLCGDDAAPRAVVGPASRHECTNLSAPALGGYDRNSPEVVTCGS